MFTVILSLVHMISEFNRWMGGRPQLTPIQEYLLVGIHRMSSWALSGSGAAGVCRGVWLWLMSGVGRNSWWVVTARREWEKVAENKGADLTFISTRCNYRSEFDPVTLSNWPRCPLRIRGFCPVLTFLHNEEHIGREWQLRSERE